MNINQIQRAKLLLTQAFTAASGTDNSAVLEAKRHMQQAILQLEKVEHKHEKKSDAGENQFQKWWGHVQSGVAAHPMDATAQNKTLAQLNKMIAAEQKTLDDLEKIPEINLVDELLKD